MLPRVHAEWRSVTAAIVIVGGVTVVVGTLLPWMTLFGGLHALPGVIGLYGRLMAGAGMLAIVLGVCVRFRGSRRLTLAISGLGVVILFFATLLLRNMLAIVGSHRGDPMMVAGAGSGLYVCMVGGGVVCAALVAEMLNELHPPRRLRRLPTPIPSGREVKRRHDDDENQV